MSSPPLANLADGIKGTVVTAVSCVNDYVSNVATISIIYAESLLILVKQIRYI